MAALADCYGEHKLGGIEDEGSENLMGEIKDCAGFYCDQENDFNSPNDGWCSPELLLVDKQPCKLPAESFYHSTTAQLGDFCETSLPKDTTYDKSRKSRVSGTDSYGWFG